MSQFAVSLFHIHTNCKYCEHAPVYISDLGNRVQGTISEFVDNVKLGSIVNCEEDSVKLQKGQRQVVGMSGQEADEIQSRELGSDSFW